MGSRKANFANNFVSLGLRPSQTWLIWDNGEKEMKDKQSGMPTICLSFFYPQTSILPSSPSSVRDPGKKKLSLPELLERKQRDCFCWVYLGLLKK